MQKKRLLFLIISSFFLSGCMARVLTADNLPWVNEDPVLFHDDYSKETGVWTLRDDTHSYAGYHQGGFRLWSNVPDYQFWSVPGLSFENTMIYVRAQKIDGTDNNVFGVMCRYQNEDNFYALLIGSDGYYGIIKRIEGQQSLIDQEHADFSELINRGEGVNEIVAVCQDEHLALFVNENRLLQVQDDALTYGDVGLIVGNFDEPGVDILFDDFIVLSP